MNLLENNLNKNKKKKVTTLQNAFVGIIAGKEQAFAKIAALKFNRNFDIYDKAIDALYNKTHIGGSLYHHIIDGSHSIANAFKIVKNVSNNDNIFKELAETLEHIGRDICSVSGINPFFTLTKQQFETLCTITTNFGITKKYVADILTINAPELFSSTIATIPTLIYLKKGNTKSLKHISGGYLFSSIVSGNPMLLTTSIISSIYIIKKEGVNRETILEIGKGSIVSTGAYTASILTGGNILIGCGVGVITSYLVTNTNILSKKLYGKLKNAEKPVLLIALTK